MAIDSSLFMVDVPAGTYAAGDKLELTIKAGPSVVRSGRGAAILKRMTVGHIGNVNGSQSYWKISAINSDWVDPMTSISVSLFEFTALDERNAAIQRGNDCPLTPNSSWTVMAECVGAFTTTVGNSLYAILDIDYPSVSSIVDPDMLPGIPATIEYDYPTAVTINALGTSAAATWAEMNVDIFKAGYEYALQKIELTGVSGAGFVALANAAGMAGLCRIIPLSSQAASIRNKIEYATKLVKGPMDIKTLLFVNSGTATTGAPQVMMDFVKRKVA